MTDFDLDDINLDKISETTGIDFNEVGAFLTDNIGLTSLIPIESMMALGAYRFCLKMATYQTLKRAIEYKWVEISRINSEPSLQFIGLGSQSLDLDGIIFPQFRGGLRQIELMRAEAGLGKPMMLVTGHGFAFGQWCITNINEIQTYFLKDGTPRKIEFSLNLKKYGDDNKRGVKGIIQKIGNII